MTTPECSGWRCPCYGNCEGFYEGELECIQSHLDGSIYAAYSMPAFTDSAYVWAPYVPLQIPVDDEFLKYREEARDAIIKSLGVPGYIIGIDTGED